ncbi:MAG: hypothetical protein P4L40_08565 [Terracidiphilus sp.]|nr:hypothetical protein [Terracidiphilus sp.]
MSRVTYQAARELADGTLKRKERKAGLTEWALEKNPIGRNILFKKTREMVTKQVCVCAMYVCEGANVCASGSYVCVRL